ncbi:hypothetical protein PTKIN_Ptkin13bG0223200 [Pterospermum kingtungense]
MAESFAFSIAETVLKKLGSVALEGISLAWGVKREFEKLQGTLNAIKAVLLDAEEQQARNHELSLWLQKFKDACYEVEDLLDEFEIEALRMQVLQRGSTGRKVRHFFSGSNPLAFSIRMGYKIKKANEMLNEIAATKAKFLLVEKHEIINTVMHSERETYSFVKTSDVVGRDQDKENIIEFLMHTTDGEDIPVLPIVGIGGLGKTALAQLVFDDERVEMHFELRIWVCVTEDFDIKQLMIKIIKSATGEKCLDKNKEELRKVLHECLSGKRFLLVLDDVWNEDKKKWIELKNLLAGGAQGSKIIATTHSNKVATITGTTPQYDLDELSDKNSLSLFLKLAFKEGEEEQHPNLVKIGEEIVQKCKGVALALKTLGSLLCSTVEEVDWERVRDSEIWSLEQKENDILPVLKLSYDHLPCFPKDYEFPSYELVSFWMAHGLLKSSKKNEDPEDIGSRYLNELLSRSFFQQTEDCFFFFTFKMHDLMHDLALSVAQNEVKSFNQYFKGNVRHIRFDLSGQGTFNLPNDLGHLRTLFLQREEQMGSSEALVATCTSRSKHLRVLHLDWSSFEQLPNSIRYLKHLRYLSMDSCGNIKKLPNFICNLQSLQTLYLGGCDEIEELPKDIRYLISLRTLIITTKQRGLQDNGIGCLSSLRFLGIFYCENLVKLFEDMQNLTALRIIGYWEMQKLDIVAARFKILDGITKFDNR